MAKNVDGTKNFQHQKFCSTYDRPTRNPLHDKIRFASFDITDMYSNVLTTKLPQIIRLMFDQLHTSKQFKREITKLSQTLIEQNYFQFQHQIFRQTEGLAMGAPIVFHSFGSISPICRTYSNLQHPDTQQNIGLLSICRYLNSIQHRFD
jgi:hypothetical protein